MFYYWPCLLPLCQEKGPGFDEIPESRLREFLAGMFLARSHWGLFCLASDLNTKFIQAVFVEWSFLKSNERKKREGKVKERRRWATCSVHSCRFPGETPDKAYSPFFFISSTFLHSFLLHSLSPISCPRESSAYANSTSFPSKKPKYRRARTVSPLLSMSLWGAGLQRAPDLPSPLHLQVGSCGM